MTPSSTLDHSTFRTRFGKAIDTLRHQGPPALMRHAAYSYYYHRHMRSRAKLHEVNSYGSVQLWGKELELPRQNVGIAEELRGFGIHEPLATAVYQDLLGSGEQIIDIGANVGYYLLAAAGKLGQRGRLLAFEPVPSNYAILQRNIERMQPMDCRSFQLAIGSRNETATFWESHISNFGGLVRHSQQEVKGEIPVDVRRLDDVLASLPDFRPTALRMDVEGGEIQVLEGARQVIATYKPLLFVEFHPFAIGMNGVRDAIEELKSVGYKDAILIDRCWDQPWIAAWARQRRSWRGTLRSISERVFKHSVEFPVFTLILKRPVQTGRGAAAAVMPSRRA